MKSILLLISCIGITLANTRVSYDGYKVWSVSPKTPDQIQGLKQWYEITSIDFWEQINTIGRPIRVMVAPVSQEAFENYLKISEIEYKLIIENAETVFETERKAQEDAKMNAAKFDRKFEGRASLDFNHFWTTTEINEYIDHLVVLYGDIMSYEFIGSSILGQNIRAVKISMHGQVDGSRPILFIDIGTHAREWASFMTGVAILHNLVEHYYENLDILNTADVIIIPNVNPDGYDHTHSTDRMWRKNRRVNTLAICPGVDLNRNYAMAWQSSINQCSEIFPGAAPFSEPETTAVRTIVERYGSSIAIYASIHSFGDFVLYPWGYDYVNIDNYQEHHALGDLFADAVVAVGGNQYAVGNAAMLLNTAFGASDDYMASIGIPLSYTIELTGGGTTGFDLPIGMVNAVTSQGWAGIRQFGLYVASLNLKK